MKSLFFVLPALLLGLTACGAPVAAVTLPDTVQVEKTQTAETAVLYEDADGREVSPRRAALTEWRWSVTDDTIAEVDPSGIVTGLRGGSTTLTLQSADGKISASCPVQVSSPLRGIALDDYTLYFDDELVTWITADGTRESDYAYASRVGAVCHLLPEDTTDHPAVTYHIADERIARFDGSWLVPVNYGTTTLTADCGGFTAQCTVTVVSRRNRQKKTRGCTTAPLVALPSISRALKTARGAVFAPRDAGRGARAVRFPYSSTPYNVQ